jgi:hypothetical protein
MPIFRGGRLIKAGSPASAVDAAILDIMEKAGARLKGEPSHALIIIDQRRKKTVVMAMVGRAS